jgi:hypothetical protein
MAIDKTNNQSNHYFKPKTSYTLRQKKPNNNNNNYTIPNRMKMDKRIQRETQQHPTQGNGWRIERRGKTQKD